MDAKSASESKGSGQVKRERDGASKAEVADDTTMVEEDATQKGDSSTEGYMPFVAYTLGFGLVSKVQF